MTGTSHLRVLATLVAGTLLIAACGADDGPADDGPGDDATGLRPPVAVEVAAAGRPTASPAELLDPVAGERSVADVAVDLAPGELTILPWYGRFEYEVGEGLPALPDLDVGYEFPAGSDVDAATVAALAAALGVEGEPQRGSGRRGDGTLWRVGPDDGTAPALVVLDDAQLGWYLTDAWSQRAGAEPCEVVLGDDGEIVEERCAEPVPPEGVPDAAGAEQRTRELLGALGEDPTAYELETYADEWAASVVAWTTTDGIRWPLGLGFGFGAQGALQWANGWLAEPVATGPYPLVDLDAAIARLAERQGAGVVLGIDAGVPIEPADPSDASDASDAGAPEMVPEIAVLVDVRADLWWVYDVAGSVWLLPAYTFTDTEGRTHTVPAVTDQFLVVELDGAPEAEASPAEPAPELPDPVELETLDAEGVVGLPVEEAAARLEVDGMTLRVARLDGEDLALTMDYRPNRVNVAVEDGVVVGLLSVG